MAHAVGRSNFSSSVNTRIDAGRSRPRSSPITSIGSSTPRTETSIIASAAGFQPARSATARDRTTWKPFSLDSASSRLATLTAMPMPQQALALGPAQIDVRGVHLPRLVLYGEVGWILLIALACGIVWALVLARWARRRQIETGETFPAAAAGLGVIAGIPLLALLLLGVPIGLRYPRLGPYNFEDGLTVEPEFLALLAGLTFYTAAFIAEIVRSGIEAVPRGQKEAAAALGLRPWQVQRLVVIPQALRVIIPPLTNQFLNLTKNSSLAVAIGYPDLVSVFAGTVLNQTNQAVEVILITMGVYLAISLLTALAMNWFNARMALVER